MEEERYPKKHKKYFCDDDEQEDDELCPTDPDLILLRRNARGERQAIDFYLNAGASTTGDLRDLFTNTAGDEMVHFRNTMTLLAKYDPEQARAFEEVGIDLPVNMLLRQQVVCPGLEPIDLLTQAISDELDAINMYQESYIEAEHDDVKALFCQNANDEKMHVAEMWRAIMDYTNESTAT
jgi:rubrerythrin